MIYQLKLKILCEGVRFDLAALKKYGRNVNIKYDPGVYNVSQELRTTVKLPQELILEDIFSNETTIVTAAQYPDSTMIVTYINEDNLGIINPQTGKSFPIIVKLPEIPNFWDDETIKGYKDVRIISTCGLYQANLWLFHQCALPNSKNECRFCGVQCIENTKDNDIFSLINAMDNPIQEYVKIKNKATDVVKVLKNAIEKFYKNHCHLVFISGNMPVGQEDYIWKYALLPIVEASFRAKIDLYSLDALAVLTPPRDLSLLKLLHEAGLPAVSFNIEFFNEHYFHKLCPAKSDYGFNNYVKAFDYALDIFGKNKVYSNLIVGVEPISETIKGIYFLAKHNIVANPVIFHRDWGSKMWHYKIKSPTQIWNFYKEISAFYKDSGMVPPYCKKCARSTLIHESIENHIVGEYLL